MTCRSLTVLSAILVKLLEFVFELKQRGSVVRLVVSASSYQIIHSIWYAWSASQLNNARLCQHLQHAQLEIHPKSCALHINPCTKPNLLKKGTGKTQTDLISSSI